MEGKSLRKNVTAIDKINDILLSLNSKTGENLIWILVEGEDDCKVYPKFFNEKARVEFVNGGKKQLEIALKKLALKSKRVIGIRDADFSNIENKKPSLNNLFFTDYHDIEMTMLSFDSVRTNLFTEHELQSKKELLWKNILTEASFVSYIRWHNEKYTNKINFKGLKFGNLIDNTDGKIIIKKDDLITSLNTRSKNIKRKISISLIENFISANNTNDYLNLCNGHDVTAIFALIIGGKISYSELCRHLRLSFHLQDFAKTNLYNKLENWQIQNQFNILKKIA